MERLSSGSLSSGHLGFVGSFLKISSKHRQQNLQYERSVNTVLMFSYIYLTFTASLFFNVRNGKVSEARGIDSGEASKTKRNRERFCQSSPSGAQYVISRFYSRVQRSNKNTRKWRPMSCLHLLNSAINARRKTKCVK